MTAVFRKKPSSIIHPIATPTYAQLTWRTVVKFSLVLMVVLLGYVVSQKSEDWLKILDRGAIKSYALTHKTAFTTDVDIRNILTQEPLLKGYFTQDIQQIKDKFMVLPWVKQVVVRKIYPDRLSITLVEHRPAAVWNMRYLLSDEGVIFTLPAERFDPTGLPILSGPDVQAKNALEAWYKIEKDLKSRNLALKSISTDVRGSWVITLDNHIELRLGRGDWLPKIDRFVTIFPEIDIPEGKRLVYVDLRYEHGAAVGFHPQ